jgi:drug/metabolite transporter (DMT)-like permease
MSIKHQILAISACIIWSAAFLLVKLGLEDMPPFLLSGSRFIIAGLMIMPFLFPFRKTFREIFNNKLLIIKTSLFQTIILYGLFFVAMQYVRGAQASIIIGSSPIISAIVAHFMQKNDKLTMTRFFSFLLGVFGVIVTTLSSKPWGAGGKGEFVGILLLLAGSVSSSIANVFVSQNQKKLSPMILNSSQMFFGGCVLFCISLIIEPMPQVILPINFWFGLFGLAFISAAGFSIWFYLLGFEKVSNLNTWKFLIPVGGSILSWLFLPNESPDLAGIAGIILVCSAILLCKKTVK